MSQLKIETKMTHAIDYSDWDSFIQKSFPNCPYEGIACEEEMTNDSTWTCTPSGNLTSERIVEIEDYLSNGKVKLGRLPNTSDILNYLVYKGETPSGHYSVDICW